MGTTLNNKPLSNENNKTKSYRVIAFNQHAHAVLSGVSFYYFLCYHNVFPEGLDTVLLIANTTLLISILDALNLFITPPYA